VYATSNVPTRRRAAKGFVDDIRRDHVRDRFGRGNCALADTRELARARGQVRSHATATPRRRSSVMGIIGRPPTFHNCKDTW